MGGIDMLCKELMYGDWIASENNGYPMQITNVGDDYAYATFEGNEGDPLEFDDKDDQPQPIPLTNDILKKNGWEMKSYMLPPYASFIRTYYFTKDEGDTHLELKGNTLTIWFNYEKNNEGVYSDIVIPVNYVHQLQRALRLAGMTDLANNFKV